MLGTLFETPEDKAVAHAYAILRGETSDGLQPTGLQIALLRIVADKPGHRKAVSIGRLAEQLHTSPRMIKDAIRDLRLNFKVRIGSSRDSSEGGYYLITCKEEAFDTARPFIRQGQAEFAIARAILEPHELRELEGQMSLATNGSEVQR